MFTGVKSHGARAGLRMVPPSDLTKSKRAEDRELRAAIRRADKHWADVAKKKKRAKARALRAKVQADRRREKRRAKARDLRAQGRPT